MTLGRNKSFILTEPKYFWFIRCSAK